MTSKKNMRTTNEVVEAARMGEACTEEELRLAIVSMRATLTLAHFDHARWACDASLPQLMRMKAQIHFDCINDGWNVPLDVRVSPEDWPGHPSLAKRKKVATAVWDLATKAAESAEP